MKILVSRLSAMGDVAMLLPVLYSVARANPEHEFTLLTQPFLANLLIAPPSNLEAMVLDTKGEERNLWGLCMYIDRLREEQFDLYLDLHDVLRTKLIRTALMLSGTSVHHLRKPRCERKALLRPEGYKDLRPLPSMPSLYRQVFAEAGLEVPTHYGAIRESDLVYSEQLRAQYPEAFEGRALVGIAPFASTESKTYDLALMEETVHRLSSAGVGIYLFGGRGQEAQRLEEWAERYPNTRSVAGRLDLGDELALISRLRVMLSMDSANMHLASLVGRPVVSVWCATHPSAGFLGIGQRLEDCLQNESLACRPCSIFGKVRRCVRGNMPCRQGVTSEQIVQKISSYIKEA